MLNTIFDTRHTKQSNGEFPPPQPEVGPVIQEYSPEYADKDGDTSPCHHILHLIDYPLHKVVLSSITGNLLLFQGPSRPHASKNFPSLLLRFLGLTIHILHKSQVRSLAYTSQFRNYEHLTIRTSSRCRKGVSPFLVF